MPMLIIFCNELFIFIKIINRFKKDGSIILIGISSYPLDYLPFSLSYKFIISSDDTDFRNIDLLYYYKKFFEFRLLFRVRFLTNNRLTIVF